jgi:hypothetical protein
LFSAICSISNCVCNFRRAFTIKHTYHSPMKKMLLLLVGLAMCWTAAFAQLPPGSTAPDFTTTDLNGNSIHLYDLLDQGKTVYIDIFATWCGPCWNYHNTGALKTLWNQHGPPGTNDVFVIGVEGDPSTNVACLYGPSGCVGGTQGNWVTGEPYPYVDDASIASAYAITYYPTIYMICPGDKKVYEVGQLSATGLYNYRASHCAVVASVASTQNVTCFGTNTGSIDIDVSGGIPPYTFNWSNGKHTEDLNNIPAGNYTVTIISGGTFPQVVIGPINIAGPPSALNMSLVQTSPAGCNGVTGSISVSASGGWGNLVYNWSNSQTGPEATGLDAGTYTVTVTDNGGCTKTLSATVAPPTYPNAVIASPGTITCLTPSIQLNGTNSSSGSSYTYQWTATSGGTILSGGTTLTPTVGSSGAYSLVVTNINNSCEKTAFTSVQANITPPAANAGPAASISCNQPTAVLQGTGSTGNGFSYLWTASNGGNISSGANTLTPTINAAGTYTLKVTNSANGCTKTSATTATGTPPPTVGISAGTISCAQPNVSLNTTTTNAGSPTYAWTGPNGFTSTQASPSINLGGTYDLVLTDATSGCTATASSTVASNTTAPGAAATGGTLNCVVQSLALAGSTSSSHSIYGWTGPNGFASSLQNPTVDTIGQYNLVVTDTINGCTSTAAAVVNLNNTLPQSAAATPGTLNCNTAQLQLSGAGSSQGQNYTYNWTTANGNIISGANTLTPAIDQPGAYALQVTNTDNGCKSTASATVILNPNVTTSIATQTNASCNNSANGAATVAPAGGNGAYSYNWSNGASTASISDLTAGTYIVVVTDGENCTSTNQVSITQPDVLLVNANATAQSANGVNDGTASANPGGGTAGYGYAWNTNDTTQSITGLAPGTYTVTVTDTHNCTAIAIVNVNAYNCTIAATSTAANVSCNGAANGSASVNLTGSADPVSYTWSNGATTANVANLAPGTYSVSVVDGKNCPASLNVSITEPAPLAANATASSETSFGANDGTATANPTGGSPMYTYLWNTGATTQSISNLMPGTYTVIVTDGNGCTSAQSMPVNPYTCNVAAQPAVANVTCAGASNGSATAITSGGNAPFNYAWNTGATGANLQNLAGGTYTATITDVNGCQATTTATVSEPAPYSPWTVNTTNPVCPDAPTGAASVDISGGTAPYTFQWSNGATGASAANLTTGSYTVVVTDQQNCQSTTSITLTASDNEPPTATVQPAVIPLDGSGYAAVTLVALSAQVADNCTVSSTKIEPSGFDCTQLGDHTVTLTVTDEAGLKTAVQTVVTVVDKTPPTLTCSPNITACFADNIVSYPAPVAQDNCLISGGNWSLVSGLESGSEFPVGTTNEIYTYTDGSGNQGTCSFEITIMPPVVFGAPTITNEVNHQGNGSIIVPVSGGGEPLTYKWTKEGQPVGGNHPFLDGATEGNYTLVVTDAFGCTYTIDNLVVHETTGSTEPMWLNTVRLQPNPTSGITRIIFAQAPETTLELTVADATGRIVMSQYSEHQYLITLDCSSLPDGVYMLRFRTGAEAGIRKLVVGR